MGKTSSTKPKEENHATEDRPPGELEMGTLPPEQVEVRAPVDDTHPVHRLHKGFKLAKGIRIRPWHILSICWRTASPASKCVNMLWPTVPIALGVKFTNPDLHLAIFILSYIAMVPCANLIGFASNETTRKVPKVLGHLVETTLAGLPEIILLLVLLFHDEYEVIQAALLGSILATLLLCLGMCFFCGGLTHNEQSFNSVVSELGSDLLLTAGTGLMIPGTFHATSPQTPENIENVLIISRITAIFLLLAFCIYAIFQMSSHHALYLALEEAEEQSRSEEPQLAEEDKLCATECALSLGIALPLVTILAISLVNEIPYIVEERGISETFLGLILVPIVEKAAEHIMTVQEALHNQMTSALFNCLGSTIQTAMFNAPLVVIIGWIANKKLDLSFNVYAMVVLILSILVVGSFTKDSKTNYLEGALCLIVYFLIAVGAFFG